MIEAMACGTPVLAFRHGSVPEVIDEGITGHIVVGMDEAIRKIGSVLALDRGRVRRRFEQRFSAQRMVRDYVKIYEKLMGSAVRRGGEQAQPMVVLSNNLHITGRSHEIRPGRSVARLDGKRSVPASTATRSTVGRPSFSTPEGD